MKDLTTELLDKVETRFYGKYRSFVVDNADPENRGRLRLRIPNVLGNDVVSPWALPCAPYGGSAGQGFFYIPDVGAGVWVEFEEGKLDFPVWVGTFWAKPGGSTEVPDPASNQSPPTSKLIKTRNHTIELADAQGGEAIKVTDAKNSNTVVMDQNGISIEDANSNQIVLTSGGITLKSSAIKIGSDSSSEPLILGNQLKTALTALMTWLGTHMHTGNLGAPTSPPLVPPDSTVNFTGIYSTKHNTE